MFDSFFRLRFFYYYLIIIISFSSLKHAKQFKDTWKPFFKVYLFLIQII